MTDEIFPLMTSRESINGCHKKRDTCSQDDLPKCQSCNCSAPHIQLYRKRQSKVVLTPTDAISKPCL